MKIIQFTAENIQKLEAVEITPQGNVVTIGGKNAAGKSAVMDAIEMAMEGASSISKKPVREGAEKGTVTLDLGDLTVTRTITTDGKTTLKVVSKDNARYPSPQRILDGLTGKLSFDPLEFTRLDPGRQAAALRDLVDIDFTKLDSDRAAAYEDRTEVNRELKQAEINVGQIELGEDAPEEEVTAASLIEELTAAHAVNQANITARAKLDVMSDDGNEAGDQITTSEAWIVDQEKILTDAKEQLSRKKAAYETLKTSYLEKAKLVKNLADVDTVAITDRINDIEAINRRVRLRKTREAWQAQANDKKAESAQLTERIVQIDREKEALLAAAQFPVEGLSFGSEGITFKGIPFEQASSAEQIRVSVAMAAAANPKLRVVLVRDGSLLDADSLKLLCDYVTENDMQLWIEIVNPEDPAAVIIEDGHVKK